MSTEIILHPHVADRAYHLWEQAGRPHGRDLEFWLQAETEVHSRFAPGQGAPSQSTATGAPKALQRNGSTAAPAKNSRSNTPRKRPTRARAAQPNRSVNPPVLPYP